MLKRLLLINPWIFDFAAYNFWIRPLGLLRVAEFLSRFGFELRMIDATDSFKLKRWGTGKFTTEVVEKPDILKQIPFKYKKYGISYDDFRAQLKAVPTPDAVLVTSIMSYWYVGVQKVIELIRDVLGGIPVILGGIYSTLYYEHAVKNSGADIVYQGCIDERILRDLNFPTHYFLASESAKPYYKLNFYASYPYAPLLTAYGCPFNCSYCASPLLSQRYKRFEIDDILKEISELAQRGVRDFAFYDDALLYDSSSHIKPLLKEIQKRNLVVRFHTPNGLHARFVDAELAGLMKETNFKTIRLSLETIDDARLKGTGDKVSIEDVKRAVLLLKKQGFTKKELGVYLMYGLPGQSLEEVMKGIEFLKSLKVNINLTEYSPIKGTRSWADLVSRGVIDEGLDPLLTNNTVFPLLYSGYNKSQLDDMKLDIKKYNARIE